MLRVCVCKIGEYDKNCPIHGMPITTFLTTNVQPVSFKTADLPRWKPKVVIDRRTLERSREVKDEGA